MDNEIVIDVDADVHLSFSTTGSGVVLSTNCGNILVTPQEFFFYRCLFKITDIGNIEKLPVNCPSLWYLLRRTLLPAEQLGAILAISIGAVSGSYKTSQQENKEFDNNEEEAFLSLHQFVLCCKMVGQLQRTPDASADHTLLVALKDAYEKQEFTPSSPSSISVPPLTSTAFANFSLGISPLTMPLRHRTWTSRVNDDASVGTVETEVLRAKVCGWELSSEAFQKQYIRFKVVTRVESQFPTTHLSSAPATVTVPSAVRHHDTHVEQLYIRSGRNLTSTDSLSSTASSSSSSRTTWTGTGTGTGTSIRTSPDHDNHLIKSLHLVGETPATARPITIAHAMKKKKGKKNKAGSEKEEKVPLPFLPSNAVAPMSSPVVSEGPWPTSPSPVSTPTSRQQPMLSSSSPVLVQEATAYRRYTDFEALVVLLRRLFKGTILPPLPPKDWTTSFQQQTLPSEIFANQRLLELQCFVVALMAHPVLGRSFEVRAFFLSAPLGLKAFKTTLAHLQVDVDSGALLPVVSSHSQSTLLGQSLAWPTVLPGGAAGVRNLTAATGKAVQAATSSAAGLVKALWGLGSAAVGKTRESFAPTTMVGGSKEPVSDDSFEEVERPPNFTPSSPSTTNTTNSIDKNVLLDPHLVSTSNPTTTTRGLTTLSVVRSKVATGTVSSGNHPYGRATNSNAPVTGSRLFATLVRNAREVASVGLMHVKLATASATSSSMNRMPAGHRGKSNGESPGTCSDEGMSVIAEGSGSTPLASPSTPTSPAATISSLEAAVFELLRYLKVVDALGDTLQALTRNDGRRIFELSQLAHAMQQGSEELSLGSATVRRSVLCFTEGIGCVAESQHNHYEVQNRDVVTPIRFLGRYLQSVENVVQQRKFVAKTLTTAKTNERKKKRALDAVRMVDATSSIGSDASASTIAKCTEALTLAQSQVSFAAREERRMSLLLHSEATSLLTYTTDSNEMVSGHKKLLLEHLVKLTTCRASSHGSAAASWEALHRDLLTVLDKDEDKDNDYSQTKQQQQHAGDGTQAMRQQTTTNSMAFSDFL